MDHAGSNPAEDPKEATGRTEHRNADSHAHDEVVAGWDGASTLEQLGERIVFLDTKDMSALATLHTDFEAFLARVEVESRLPEVSSVAAMTIELISQLILEDMDRPEEATAILGQMVDYIRAALRTGHTPPMPEAWHAFQKPGTPGVPAGPTASEIPPPPPADEQDPFANDPELLREFFQEAREHLTQAEVHLLTLEAEPEDKDAISAVFRAFHTVKGAAGFLQLADILSLSHVSESLLDKVRTDAIRMEGPVIDLCLEAVDGLKKLVEDRAAGEVGAPAGQGWIGQLVQQIDALVQGSGTPERLGQILVHSGSLSPADLERALEEQSKASDPKPKLGEVLVAGGHATAQDTVEALRAQKEQRRPATVQRDSIKVDADRLDQLVDLIGELVIAQAMVRQSDEAQQDPMSMLCHRLGHMDKITRELQSISMSLRMVPIRATFQKMARLVRDLARKFGKDVDFVTEGEDTELDKNVVDQVADPLMHMVRNAIDHGIETPEERLRQGKPARARVVLRAYHEGGGIYIDIVDDGRGLDREAILVKAADRGLIQPGDVLPDKEVWKLIFHPGLSTAKEVTDVSGRGVGMDVVHRNIKALHGRVDVESHTGTGSTFSIRLPLTLAIIDGMAITAGAERFIIPIGNVVRATRPEPGEVHSVKGRGEVLHQHDRLIPLFRLHQLMSVPDAIDDPEQGIVLVLEESGRQIGLLADDLLGQQQVVIKPLGRGVGTVLGLAGGAIMPDGQVGLILDTAGLFQKREQFEASQTTCDIPR